MTTTTMTALATERMVYAGPDNTGEGYTFGDTILYRPQGVYLQNDGKVHYWLHDGYGYQLRYDGTGWQVLTDGQPYGGDGHVRRLATGGVLVCWLPRPDGSWIGLDPAGRYEIRMSGSSAALVEL